MKFKSVAMLLLAVMVSPVVAQETDTKKKKKGRGNPTAQLMRQFKDVEFTEEQKGKVDALAKEAVAAMKTAREEAGITAEMLKKRAAAQKEMRAKETDQKPAQLMKAVNEKAGFTEKHAEGLKKANTIRQKWIKDVVGLLSEEQQSKLPEKLLQAAKRKSPKKGAGKGKKAKADDK
ncbi:MAG: hypothetical protein AAFX06_21205 [Planctomycetota bacterium]